MSLRRVLLCSLATVVLAAPAAAQGIPRGATIRQRPSASLTRIMVANPYVFARNDSATAVAVGRAMRDRMSRFAPRTEFSVISDSLMNAALVQYDYPPDAILNRSDAQTLARQIAGRVLITSQMSRSPSGQWTLISRLSGTNDDAGMTVRVSQASAAPQALVWATGLTPAVPLIVLFAGIYAGRRGWRFGGFAAGLVGLAYLQRLPLIVWSWYATGNHAGTHLDLSGIDSLNVPLFGGPGPGAGPTKNWIYGTLIPHLTVWIVVTVVLGLVLGGIGWWASYRRER